MVFRGCPYQDAISCMSRKVPPLPGQRQRVRGEAKAQTGDAEALSYVSDGTLTSRAKVSSGLRVYGPVPISPKQDLPKQDLPRAAFDYPRSWLYLDAVTLVLRAAGT